MHCNVRYTILYTIGCPVRDVWIVVWIFSVVWQDGDVYVVYVVTDTTQEAFLPSGPQLALLVTTACPVVHCILSLHLHLDPVLGIILLGISSYCKSNTTHNTTQDKTSSLCIFTCKVYRSSNWGINCHLSLLHWDRLVVATLLMSVGRMLVMAS